jgi:hypothetical protein
MVENDALSLKQRGFTEDSWANARHVAAGLGPIIPPIQSSIRALISNDSSAEAKMKVLRQAMAMGAYRESLRQFCVSIFPETKFEYEGFSPKVLTNLLGFDTCAVILGLLFTYRKVRKGSSESQLEVLADQIHSRAEVGYYLGHELRDLGAAEGMLLGGMRFLALGLIANAYPELFDMYVAHTKSRKVSFDLHFEIDRWGFSHPQVMALITQLLGFGDQAAIAMFIGLSPIQIIPENEPLAHRFRTSSMWIESLEAGRVPASFKSIRGFEIAESDIRKLSESVIKRTQSHTAVFWLD